MKRKRYKPLDLNAFLTRVVGEEGVRPKEIRSNRISLADLVRRCVVVLYMKDTGKFGDSPKEHAFWERSIVKIDARTTQAMENEGLVVGRSRQNGISSEICLTEKGVQMAKKSIGV